MQRIINKLILEPAFDSVFMPVKNRFFNVLKGIALFGLGVLPMAEFIAFCYALFTGSWWVALASVVRSGVAVFGWVTAKFITSAATESIEKSDLKSSTKQNVREGLVVLVDFLFVVLRVTLVVKAFREIWYNAHRIVEEGRPGDKRISDFVKTLLWCMSIPLVLILDAATVFDLFRPILTYLNLNDSFERIFKTDKATDDKTQLEKDRLALDKEKFEFEKTRKLDQDKAQAQDSEARAISTSAAAARTTVADLDVCYKFIKDKDVDIQEIGWRRIFMNEGYAGVVLDAKVEQKLKLGKAGLGFVSGGVYDPQSNREEKIVEGDFVPQAFSVKGTWKRFKNWACVPNPILVGTVSLLVVCFVLGIVYCRRDTEVVNRVQLKKKAKNRINKKLKPEGQGSSVDVKDVDTKAWQDWKEDTIFVFGQVKDPVQGFDINKEYEYGQAWASLMDGVDVPSHLARFKKLLGSWSNDKLKGYNFEPEAKTGGVTCTCGKTLKTAAGLKAHQGAMEKRGSPCVASEGKPRTGYSKEKKQKKTKQQKHQEKNAYSRQQKDRENEQSYKRAQNRYRQLREDARDAMKEALKDLSSDSWEYKKIMDDMKEIQKELNNYNKIQGEGASASQDKAQPTDKPKGQNKPKGTTASQDTAQPTVKPEGQTNPDPSYKGTPTDRDIMFKSGETWGKGWSTMNLVFMPTHVNRLFSSDDVIEVIQNGVKFPSVKKDQFVTFPGKRDLMYCKYQHPGVNQISLSEYNTSSVEPSSTLDLVIGNRVQKANVNKVDGIECYTSRTNTVEGDSGSQYWTLSGRFCGYHIGFLNNKDESARRNKLELVDAAMINTIRELAGRPKVSDRVASISKN